MWMSFPCISMAVHNITTTRNSIAAKYLPVLSRFPPRNTANIVFAMCKLEKHTTNKTHMVYTKSTHQQTKYAQQNSQNTHSKQTPHEKLFKMNTINTSTRQTFQMAHGKHNVDIYRWATWHHKLPQMAPWWPARFAVCNTINMVPATLERAPKISACS
jgi:hypothetical protein